MSYVDGFVLAVQADRKEEYRRHAELAARVFKDHGALAVAECWGHDVPEGKVTSFPMAVKLQPGETVVFSWVVWPDRAARDRGMKAFMEDPHLDGHMKDMPFDGQRLIHGGFEMIVDA